MDVVVPLLLSRLLMQRWGLTVAAADNHSFSNWSGGSDAQGGESMPLLGPMPSFRGAKDQRLASYGASPDVQHPDGYLGTMSSNRRQDKLLSAVHRQNHRSYSRGVHKGERVNPGDYLWPEEFTPMMGIERQMVSSKRFGPVGQAPVTLTNDGKSGPRGLPTNLDRPQQEIIDAQRQSMLKSLVPRWK
jgi:hypothetical protein